MSLRVYHSHVPILARSIFGSRYNLLIHLGSHSAFLLNFIQSERTNLFVFQDVLVNTDLSVDRLATLEQEGQFLCKAHVEYGRPKRALNTRGAT